MKIIIVGNTTYDSLENHLNDTFNLLGHHSQLIGLSNRYPMWAKTRYWLARFSEWYDRHYCLQLADTIVNYKPDFILVVYRHLHPILAATLKNRLPDTPLAQYNPDALTNLERQEIIAAPFDFYFTKEPYIANVLRNKARLNAYYLPEAFNPVVNVKPATVRHVAEEETDIDVLMYGGLYPNRARIIEQLVRAGIKITLFGSPTRYMSSEVRRCYTGNYLVGTEKNRLVYGAKIVFNNLHYAEVSSANKKYFEINGIGGFQLCDYKPTLAEYSGVPVEKVTFNSIDEAIDQIRYYLDKPAERYALSDQQYAHFQAHHTYEKRVQQLLSIVFGHA